MVLELFIHKYSKNFAVCCDLSRKMAPLQCDNYSLFSLYLQSKKSKR